MARPRAIEDKKIFAIADQLTEKGIDPSIVRVAEVAKRRYGATPSYTTLKSVLSDWSSRPADQKVAGDGLSLESMRSEEMRAARELMKEVVRSLNMVREELANSTCELTKKISALEARIARLDGNAERDKS